MACTAIAEVRYPPSAQLISGMSFYSGTCRCGWHRAPDPARDGQLITSSRAGPVRDLCAVMLIGPGPQVWP